MMVKAGRPTPRPADEREALRAAALICGAAAALRMVEANRPKAPDSQAIDLAQGP